jgi:pSer/pThr/pTyr-binding forkhead associated (FHA) protein
MRRPGHADLRAAGLLAGLLVTRPVIIGRSRSCDLVLGSDSVSRRHAMLALRRGRVIVHDLGSTNGVWLNGRIVTRAEVQPGDRLRLGEVDLLL